jgi:hypothetical protein
VFLFLFFVHSVHFSTSVPSFRTPEITPTPSILVAHSHLEKEKKPLKRCYPTNNTEGTIKSKEEEKKMRIREKFGDANRYNNMNDKRTPPPLEEERCT